MVSTAARVTDGVDGTEHTYARTPQVLDVPNLIQVQLDSFEWFKTEGLEELFREITPIEDFPGGRFELGFLEHRFEEPPYTEDECRERESTYSPNTPNLSLIHI